MERKNLMVWKYNNKTILWSGNIFSPDKQQKSAFLLIVSLQSLNEMLENFVLNAEKIQHALKMLQS